MTDTDTINADMADTDTPVENTDETATADTDTTSQDTTDAADDSQADGDTFPREVVEKLRKESAGYRDRAKTAEARADELARRLHTALVAATGKLADPSDLPFDAEHLDDPDALAAAIDTLTAAKPHLKSRKPTGDIGQGVRGTQDAPVDLAAILRQHVV